MRESHRRKLQLFYKVCQSLNRDIDDPDLKRLSLEQLQYINHSLEYSCYLQACPGSGKTEVVGIKAAYEFANWTRPISGIAVLSFTRNAASEIKKRVTKYAGSGAIIHPHFIGTVDSWLHSYLLNPFAYHIMGYDGRDGDKSIRIVEDDSRARFLDNYKTIARGSRGTYVIPIHKFYKDYRGRLDSIRFDLRDIDARLRDRLDQSKSRFHNDGFATYQDAEYLCLCMLRHYEWLTKLLSARFPHIIIDECQDLSDVQLCILYELLEEETTLHFVGDLDQAIYAFKKVNPDHIDSFVERQGFFVRRLKTNYRSNQSIADVCTNLMNTRPIIGNESERFEESCVLWQYTDENLSSLKRHFHELTQDAGLTTDKCCVIARGRSVLEALQPERIGIRSSCVALCANALQCWHATNSSTEDLTTALSNIGEAISRLAYSGYGNRQNQSCPEDLSPKEWRWFLAKTLDGFNGLYPFVDQDGQDLTWSDWARELKAYLCDLWDELPLHGEDWDNVRRRIRSPRGLSRSAVSSTVGRPNIFSGLRITTIHNVKGETFEAVLLVSSPDRRSPGGHFSHWLNPKQGKEEYQRFAYVACSRPKHLLVVATPKLDVEELRPFEKLGFIPKDIDDHDIGLL